MKYKNFVTSVLLSFFMIYGNPGKAQPSAFPIEFSQIELIGAENLSDNDSLLILKPVDKSGGLEITDPVVLDTLNDYQFLIVELSHENPYSGIFSFEFFTMDNPDRPRISAKIGILPGMSSYMVFPLNYLDGQQIFINRYPWQLKGVVFGKRTNPQELKKIKLLPLPNEKGFVAEYMINSIRLSNELPVWSPADSVSMTDKYGQWSNHDWKGKIRDESDWEKHREEMKNGVTEQASYPDNWSEYGGWKELRFDSTGFFTTHYDGTRWWLVDPSGYAFLSYGMDCVNTQAGSLLEGDEELYEWLPAKQEEYSKAFYDIRGLAMVNFFRINMIRSFGSEWYDQWQKLTVNKLKNAGFNTIGNWSDHTFIKKSRMPYVLPLSGFPETEVNLFRDFPDVFSPQYRFSAKEFAAGLEEYKEDKYLIGYFLRNEPQWAFGDHDLALEMFADEKMSFSKMKFSDWLRDRYNYNIDSLNLAWQFELNSFTEIRDLILTDYPSEAAANDFREFTKLLVDTYISVVCNEVKKVDPNHLNLGMRYAYISSDLLYRAGEYFDVFSINGYAFEAPAQTAEIFEKTGKPVMIGEFHFGAIDRGLPSTGLRGVATQKDRGKAYRYYLENGFTRPEVIGIHYFQWIDQPVLGRFDGENYNIGFNDIVYQAYPELYRAALKTHQKSYRLATGKGKPYRKKPKKIPAIAF